MMFRFALKDVEIKITSQKKNIISPLFTDEWHQVNQNEFTLDVERVAWYYARNGNYIEIYPYDGFDKNTLELYLNGSVYGAILHQRTILPLHGSSFIYNKEGIMVCGESGAGKSSLTAAFCLNGANFLTDDISPVAVNNSQPIILTLSDRIKLWDDTLFQLNLQKEGLEKIDTDAEKFYFPMDTSNLDQYLLNRVFILEIHDEISVEFQEIKGAEKLTSIRNQIYRLEYLQGMPQNESAFFKTLADVSNNVTVTRIKRPAEIPVQQLMDLLKKQIALKQPLDA
jgi:hypothetical protein